MGWNFRKSFKLLSGVRLNIGKKGLSGFTLGKRGVTTSVGKRGIFQNLGIPGTGLSHRSKVGGSLALTGALIGVGVLGVIVVGVIALFVIFVGFGTTSQRQEPASPSRPLLNAASPTSTPLLTKTPIIKKSKK